eukprot:6928559-Prorocentrum_lima.AAC.1
MRKSIPEWRANGTTEAKLLNASANLDTGFLNTTGQFERLSKMSSDDGKMIKRCGQRLTDVVKKQMTR